MKKTILLLVLILGIISIMPNDSAHAANNITERLKGRLLLQVEQGGAIWYVNPLDSKKYQVTFANALSLFENFALGITNADLIKIPANIESIPSELDTDNDGYKDRTELQHNYSPYIPGNYKGKFTIDNNLTNRLKGRLLLQVEQKGAIWYVDHTGIRYNVRWDNLMNLFRSLALGITDADLALVGNGKNLATQPSCMPSWQCSNWSICSTSETQTRVCSDVNNCGSTKNKPTESQSCHYQALTGSEPIVFAINASYAAKTPDWKKRADGVVQDINNVFLKTTKKEYKIEKYLTYNDLDYEKTWNDPNFHIKWGNLGATTIIFLIHKDGISVDELKIISPSNIVNAAMDANINGVNYHNIVIAQSESWNVFLGKNQQNNYQTQLGVILHELGHACGLALPDWYLYSYKDCTKNEPLLQAYNIREIYPKDPMTSSEPNEYQFSESNSKIIDMNLDHRYSYMDINQWFTKTTSVYVTDAHNNPLSNAQVKIFCVRKNCFYCNTSCDGQSGVVNSSSPEQILYTDNSGLATYNGPSGNWDLNENTNTQCIAKAIKVYYQGKSQAKYVNFLDLQKDYLDGEQVHTDHIIIDL